jgi:hypothetical protein
VILGIFEEFKQININKNINIKWLNKLIKLVKIDEFLGQVI